MSAEDPATPEAAVNRRGLGLAATLDFASGDPPGETDEQVT